MGSVKAHDRFRISSDHDTLEVRRQIGGQFVYTFFSHFSWNLFFLFLLYD